MTGDRLSILKNLEKLAPFGILLTDNALTITGWNEWLQAHSGYGADQAIGHKLADLYPQLRERNLLARFGEALRGKIQFLEQSTYEYLLPMAPDLPGCSFPHMQQTAQVMPLISNGRIDGTLTLIHDVTDRVLRDCELQQAAQREKAARDEAESTIYASDELLALFSHQIRTPLNAILGFTRLLRGGKLDEKSSERALEIIERNTRIQVRILDDLLDKVRIMNGRLNLKKQALDLRAVVQGALDAEMPNAQTKGIKLERRIPEEGLLVHADHKRLLQVVTDLLSNAIKVTPPAGRVSLTVRRVDDYAEVVVHDTGRGMVAESLPFIFDPFRHPEPQAGKTENVQAFGLAIIRRLMDLHNGTVVAESEGEDRGSTFTIRLPILRKTDEGPGENRPQAGSNETVRLP